MELLLRWREVAREADEQARHAHANGLAPRHVLAKELPGPEQAHHGHQGLRDRHVLRIALDEKPEEDECHAVQDGGDGDADALLRGQRIRPEFAAIQTVVGEHRQAGDAHEDHVRPCGGGAARQAGDDGPAPKANGGDENQEDELQGRPLRFVVGESDHLW